MAEKTLNDVESGAIPIAVEDGTEVDGAKAGGADDDKKKKKNQDQQATVRQVYSFVTTNTVKLQIAGAFCSAAISGLVMPGTYCTVLYSSTFLLS